MNRFPAFSTNNVAMIFVMVLTAAHGEHNSGLVPDRYLPILTVWGMLTGVWLIAKEIAYKKALKIAFLSFWAIVILLAIIDLAVMRTPSFNPLFHVAAVLLPGCCAFWWGVSCTYIYTEIPEGPNRRISVLSSLAASHFLMINFTDKTVFWMWFFNFIPGVELGYTVKMMNYAPRFYDFFSLAFW